MFALRALDGAAYALSHTEETGTRPMGPSDLTGDNCEGPIAPAVPFEPVGMDKHGMGDAAPFAHKPRAGLQRNRRCGLLRVACLRVAVQAFQLADDRFGEAAERPLLEFVIARIKRSRDNRIGGGARCSRRHSPRSSKIVEAESPASDSAISIDGLAMSATAARLDAVTADVACRFRSGQRTKLLLHRARQKPAHAVLLPVCCLHHLFPSA